MCFFNKPKAPDPVVVTPPPNVSQPPAPTPTVQPSTVSPQQQAETRRKKLARLRSGLASTIKTSARGITGSGADLSAPASGKQNLGS